MSELKPCPYHGDPNAMEYSGASNKYASCSKCDRGNERWYRPVENWNNAWAWKQLDLHKSMIERLVEHIVHDEECSSLGWQAGEPTSDGGYRTRIRGKWYQSKPIDETPKCDCGVDKIYSEARALLDGSRGKS